MCLSIYSFPALQIWDWDRTSRNDFMGSLSFGISELLKAPADGWFKLLTQEEGEFYNVPVPEEGTDLAQLKNQMRATSVAARRPPPPPDREVPHNMAAADVIRASDFNFVMVLGKGSFGKVHGNLIRFILFCCETLTISKIRRNPKQYN